MSSAGSITTRMMWRFTVTPTRCFVVYGRKGPALSRTKERATLSTEEIEDLESFRQRARAFIAAELRPIQVSAVKGLRSRPDDEELEAVARDRQVQRML